MTLNWCIAYLVVAILAGLLGFSTLFGSMVWMVRGLSVAFLVLFIWSLAAHRRRVRSTNPNLDR